MRNAIAQGYRFRIGDMAITDRIKRKPKANTAPTDFGTQGHPLDRSHPFYFGFVGTLGALVAIVLMRALASTSQIFVLIIVALFLATGLNPAVEAIQRRGMSRTNAVVIIFISVIVFVVFFIAVVIPPVVSQGTQLINSGPALLAELKNNSTIADLNTQFGIIDTLQAKLKEITADGTLIISAFGGVIGVGKSVLSGAFTALTVLILTLYFITSLPQMVDLGVRFVPASRRDRVSRLVNAVISRVIRWQSDSYRLYGIGICACAISCTRAAITNCDCNDCLGLRINPADRSLYWLLCRNNNFANPISLNWVNRLCRVRGLCSS
jgi:hypothetical protein